YVCETAWRSAIDARPLSLPYPASAGRNLNTAPYCTNLLSRARRTRGSDARQKSGRACPATTSNSLVGVGYRPMSMTYENRSRRDFFKASQEGVVSGLLAVLTRPLTKLSPL